MWGNPENIPITDNTHISHPLTMSANNIVIVHGVVVGVGSDGPGASLRVRRSLTIVEGGRRRLETLGIAKQRGRRLETLDPVKRKWRRRLLQTLFHAASRREHEIRDPPPPPCRRRLCLRAWQFF